MDPTIAWANPQAIEEPLPPFNLFPPGYQNAQFPVARVTHTHGLVVLPQMDGTANEWFTNVQYRGPSFTTNDYTMPNDQPSTQLFYHDHVLGVTRLGVYGGEVGAGYMIRDPNAPLDQPSSPLPKGQFEVLLGIATRAFFTDGQLHFPPDPGELNAGADAPPEIAYWSYNEGADTVVVNGKTWPNLNVQRRQYRFRMLGGREHAALGHAVRQSEQRRHRADDDHRLGRRLLAGAAGRRPTSSSASPSAPTSWWTSLSSPPGRRSR